MSHYIVTTPDGTPLGGGEFDTPEEAGEEIANQVEWPEDTAAATVNVIEILDAEVANVEGKVDMPQEGLATARANLDVKIHD